MVYRVILNYFNCSFPQLVTCLTDLSYEEFNVITVLDGHLLVLVCSLGDYRLNQSLWLSLLIQIPLLN